MVSLDLNSRARRLLNSSPNEDVSSYSAAPAEAARAHQTGWVGTLLFYRGALYWCRFDSASQKRSFMGKTSEGRSKRQDAALKAGGMTRWLEWRRMFIRSNLSKGEWDWTKNIQISILLRGSAKGEGWSCGAMLPSAGQRQKDAVAVSRVDANWQTASLAAFQAEFIKRNQACDFYIRTRQYNGLDYFTSRHQIQRASLRFSERVWREFCARGTVT